MIICLGTTPAMQRTMTFRSITIDAVNRAIGVRESAAGKAVNVARVLHTLGADALAVGFLGGDRGAFMRRDLDAAGIRHDFVEVEPNTRLCTTVIDQGAGTATELVEESSPVGSAAYDRLIALLRRRLTDAQAIVMSGGLTPDAPADLYAQVVQLAHDCGVMSIVDATGEPLRRAVQARPTIVKINEREYRSTFDRDTLEHGRLLDDGLERGVITRGAEPALAWNERAAWWIHLPKVKIVSPIGSGDAFAAGLAAGLVRGDSMPEACCLGAACAVANAITPVSGFVELSDVQRLREQMRVEPL